MSGIGSGQKVKYQGVETIEVSRQQNQDVLEQMPAVTVNYCMLLVYWPHLCSTVKPVASVLPP